MTSRRAAFIRWLAHFIGVTDQELTFGKENCAAFMPGGLMTIDEAREWVNTVKPTVSPEAPTHQLSAIQNLRITDALCHIVKSNPHDIEMKRLTDLREALVTECKAVNSETTRIVFETGEVR